MSKIVAGTRVRIFPKAECSGHFDRNGLPHPGDTPGAEGVVVEIYTGSHRYYVSDSNGKEHYVWVDTCLNRSEFKVIKTA